MIAIDLGEVIVYKGWEIRETINPWANYYGYHWECNNDENIHQFETLEDCYQFIDELTNY